MTKTQTAERDEALTQLREWIKPGDTVYCVLRHVSRSGMQREIGLVFFKDGCDLHPNYSVAKALGMRQGKHDGLVIGGCGMDMGFALVSDLSARLYPNGFGCIGEHCPSNDHSNGDRDRMPHVECPDAETPGAHDYYRETGKRCKRPACHWHRSGDYAVKHRWL